MYFYIEDMLKTHGSRESSPSARKKEKPRKLFHETATKSATVSSQPDPGMVPLSYIEYDFLLVRVSASRGRGRSIIEPGEGVTYSYIRVHRLKTIDFKRKTRMSFRICFNLLLDYQCRRLNRVDLYLVE